MISDPNLILYACVSNGTTVLAELSSGDHDLETLALQCLEKTPSLHVMFSHTIRKKIYSFLMEDPFVYFAIFDEDLGKLQGFRFLERVKDAFLKFLKTKSIKGLDTLTSHCFHEELTPVFLHMLASSKEVETLDHPNFVARNSRNISLDSRSGRKAVFAPLLGKSSKHSKKKKKGISSEANDVDKESSMENKVDGSDDANFTMGLSLSLQKHNSYTGNVHHQAQKTWRRYVYLVLLLDLMVCCVLFVVWAWICVGFQCLSS